MALINLSDYKEGEIFNKYLHSRLIKNNKNVIVVTTGPTGSGKSYIDLRVAELWYKYQFKKAFPMNHICFSIEELMNLLNSKTLKRGDLIILEEAGVSMGALDFQTQISKMFNYILQSFRSLNMCLIMNLPYLSMLNRTARLLVHVNFLTTGINFDKKISQVKPFIHQVNQQSGKIYTKYLLVSFNSKLVPIKRFNYSLPSKELCDAYEKRKLEFLNNLIEKNTEKINAVEKKMIQETRYLKPLTARQQEVYDQLKKGKTQQKDLASYFNVSISSISQCIASIRKRGYIW